MILTSNGCVKHLFAGQNTQYLIGNFIILVLPNFIQTRKSTNTGDKLIKCKLTYKLYQLKEVKLIYQEKWMSSFFNA